MYNKTYIKMTNVIFTITFQGIKNYHKYGTQRKNFYIPAEELSRKNEELPRDILKLPRPL